MKEFESNQELLEFAVNFAQTDISALREGDWLNLKEDIWSFLRGPISGNEAVVLPGSSGILESRSEAETLQKEMYSLLSEVVDTPERNLEPQRHQISFDLEVGFSREVAAKLSAGDAPWFFVHGAQRDRMLLNLFFLLMKESTEKIRRCDASDCKRIFYRVRKQKFCSVRCQSRESARRFRLKWGADKQSESNHKNYKNRVEKSRGRPTRVARRTRRGK